MTRHMKIQAALMNTELTAIRCKVVAVLELRTAMSTLL